MSTQAASPDWLDAKTPDIGNLLNVALDTLKRVQATGAITDSTLAADITDTIGQLGEAVAEARLSGEGGRGA